MLFNHDDSIGIIACSDGILNDYNIKLKHLTEILENMGLKVKFAKTLYRIDGPFSGLPQTRANELMSFYSNPNIKAIFDISGGDSANQILDYLDYQLINNNAKPFFGISDLSVILNAIYECSKTYTYHYTIRNLVGRDMDRQVENFFNTFFKGTRDIYDINYTWLRGESMNGIVVGGNIRCFMKLAGTRYIPDPTDKILFLESLGGGPNRIASLLAQLKHIGYLDKIKGIILGTFTEMERNKLKPNIDTLILEATKENQIPIVKTKQLGHSEDGKCIIIGKEHQLAK